MGLSLPVIFAKIQSAEYSDALRWSQSVIDLADGDPSKGNLIIGSPLAVAFTTRAHARWCLGRPGWRDDLRHGLAMARSADPVSYAAVVAYVYFPGIPCGVLRPDDSAVREIEDALRIAERSGDDLALAVARMTLGVALVHRQTAAERDRGQKLLAEVSDVFVRRGYLLAELPIVEVYVARERARRGDRDEAIPLMRAAADHLFREGRLLLWGIAATGVLVETLLDRGADGDVAEAEAAIDQVGGRASRRRTGDARNLAAAAARATGAGARRRDRLPRLSGSLPRDGDIAGLRGAHGVGRGDAMTAAAPSGVVTFLFTDIEGSTRRWEADADAMRAALLAHDEVLRTAIEAHDGFLFSHTGDGVVAAFASPKCAVDAAVAAQRALELPVRMGMATGEAELRDGDYFGTVLNRAARVMAAGHGGQILVADSTAVLLSGVDLIDLGPRRLRDVPTPVGVFQVRAPGLATDFPPLRALDTSPGNLRPAATSFIGRESEVAEVQAALHQHRLVTLTGVGGVGKTRLATEVAARLADEFPDGVWFFELAAVTDPAAVPDAVAAVLGITQQPGKSVSESVATALEGRTRLLVFDNCEHVLDAAADLVEAILAQSATVKVLATSREGLGVGDEQVWPVPSLDLSGGIDSAAVNLFVERAQSVAPRFSMATPDEADAVVEICRRLDGIPLAIELARLADGVDDRQRDA